MASRASQLSSERAELKEAWSLIAGDEKSALGAKDVFKVSDRLFFCQEVCSSFGRKRVS